MHVWLTTLNAHNKLNVAKVWCKDKTWFKNCASGIYQVNTLNGKKTHYHYQNSVSDVLIETSLNIKNIQRYLKVCIDDWTHLITWIEIKENIYIFLSAELTKVV